MTVPLASLLRLLPRPLRAAARAVRWLAEYGIIRAGGLFAADFYRAAYPDAARFRLGALMHYVVHGAAEGRDPHPLFSTRAYRERNPDVAARWGNPFAHYCLFGLRELRDPGPFLHVPLLGLEGPADRRADGVRRCLLAAIREPHPRRSSRAYRSWLLAYPEQLDDAAAAAPRLRGQGARPEVSVLVAVADEEACARLDRTLDALLDQSAVHWELVAAVAPGIPEHAVAGLRAWCGARPEAGVVDGGDARAAALLNAAARASRGRFLLVLDPGDVLAPLALAALAAAAEDANAAIVYADEDRLDADGGRSAPRFKPGWSPLLFTAADYLGRPVLVARDDFAAAGGYREEAGPAHEHDLLLRVAAAAGDDRVRHVARILCHRRPPGSPSPAAAEASRRAVAAHLRRIGAAATVATVRGRWNRVSFAPPSPPPRVSVIVPTRDRPELLRRCLAGLARTAYPDFEVLVVDNDSRDAEALGLLRALEPPFRLLRHAGPFNFSALNNRAAAAASGDVLLFLNNDTEVLDPGWLGEMVALAVRPGIGAVGARLLYPDGLVQHAGVVLGAGGVAANAFAGLAAADDGDLGRAVVSGEFSAVTAACLAVRRELFAAAGGFDEAELPVEFNDVDLCLKLLRLGVRNVLCAGAELLHHESASRAARRDAGSGLAASARTMRARWLDLLEHDPAYNPHLSLVGAPFEPACPPRLRPRHLAEAARPGSLEPYADAENWSRAIAVREHGAGAPARPDLAPGLAVVILTRDAFAFIAPLLDQLLAAREALEGRGPALEIVVGDTGSTDARVLQRYTELAGRITLVRGMRYHFSRCNNELVRRHVTRDTILFLNNDISFADAADSLAALAAELAGGEGIVGALLTYPDGRIQHAGISFFADGPARGLPFHEHHGSPGTPRPRIDAGGTVAAITGACLGIRASLFAELGGFDEGYATECQDVALCLAARRIGRSCRLVDAGRIDHHENGTRPRGSEDWRDRRRFVRRHGSFLEARPW